jgi:hypothetical protein
VADSKGRYPDELRLRPGVSLTQTRFALSNFCLSNLGVEGQHLADALEFCVKIHLLQEALNAVAAEVHSRHPDRLPALIACVREANATDADASRAAPPPLPAAPPQPVAPASSAPAAPPARGLATKEQRREVSDPLHLVAGISLAQARFVLSEFCLDQFGARGQPLLDAIDRCTDIGTLQKILTRLGSEVEQRSRASLPKLLECVREINETSG